MDADTSELAHCLQGFMETGACLTEQAMGCVQHPFQQAHHGKQRGLRCSIGGRPVEAALGTPSS